MNSSAPIRHENQNTLTWQKWIQNFNYWVDTTSFHGPAEIRSDRNTWCNVFWLIVIVTMTILVVILNHMAIETFAKKLPSTSVNFEHFKDDQEIREFYKLVYCPSAFLNISMLIKDNVKYSAVIYALLLLEGNTIGSDNQIQSISDTVGDTRFDELLANNLITRIQFGGALASFLTLSLDINPVGEIISLNESRCPYCTGVNSSTCFRQPLLDKIKNNIFDDPKDPSGCDVGHRTLSYITDRNFTSVYQFLTHYAVNFQEKDEAPVYTSRFRRICQIVSPVKSDVYRNVEGRRPNSSPGNIKLIYPMVYNGNNMSPCNIDRRAISLYTGTRIIEDWDNSYPYLEDIRTSDQNIGPTKNIGQNKESHFVASVTKYSYLRRPANKCFQNNAEVDKYPYFADVFLNCVDTCDEKYTNTHCLTRLMGHDSQNTRGICALNIVNNTEPNCERNRSQEKQNQALHGQCLMDCEIISSGYCTTYDITLQLDSYVLTDRLQAMDPVGRSAYSITFKDIIVVKLGKRITSFVEVPQIQIEALFGQIGGNLGTVYTKTRLKLKIKLKDYSLAPVG